jgi:ATP-dependent Lon protease
MTDIILSRENLKDVEEINEVYLKGVKFHYVTHLMDVLNLALLKQKVKGAVKIA